MEDTTIFQKIINKDIASYIIYEDNLYIAILDIFPKSKGHVLLITKEPYKWTYDVPYFGEYFEKAKEIGLHIKEKLGAEYISFQTYGVQIPHAHIHIIPFYQKKETLEKIKMEPREFENLVTVLKYTK